MPIYTYKCPTCDLHGDAIRTMAEADDPQSCPQCGNGMNRIPTRFSTSASMPAHFNNTVNQHVRSASHFRDILKAQSDEQTLRTGIEHNYVQHDPREAKDALGVTDEGLEATHRARHDAAVVHDVSVRDPDRRHPAEWGLLSVSTDVEADTRMEDTWL